MKLDKNWDLCYWFTTHIVKEKQYSKFHNAREQTPLFNINGYCMLLATIIAYIRILARCSPADNITLRISSRERPAEILWK